MSEAMEFAERLRSYVRSGWHNHAIVRELDAFAARAVSAERERLREMVANVPHDIWDIIDNDGDPVSAPIDALAALVADLRAGKEG